MHALLRRITLSIAIAALPLVGTVTFAAAAPTINVSLSNMDMSKGLAVGQGYGVAGVDHSKTTMLVKATPATVKAGAVTFVAKNDSKETIHYLLVIYLADPSKPLPYLADQKKVDEDKAGVMGEVSELDPGKSGSLTVNLKPGKYLLICNMPGHYDAGMWTPFEVTK
jgi:uncharacterized cupredoxin-like copper-binding protein